MPPQEGNCYYRWGKREMTELFFDFLLQKRISIANLITHRISPKDAPATYSEILEHRDRFMGVVIDWAN